MKEIYERLVWTPVLAGLVIGMVFLGVLRDDTREITRPHNNSANWSATK